MGGMAGMRQTKKAKYTPRAEVVAAQQPERWGNVASIHVSAAQEKIASLPSDAGLD